MKCAKMAALACALLLCSGMAYAADSADVQAAASAVSGAVTRDKQVMAQGSTQVGNMPGNGMMPPGGANPPGGFNPPGKVTQGTAARNLTEKATIKNQVFGSAGNDENALRVTGATVTLNHVDIIKQAGKSSSTEGGDFYGMNAALLATDGAQVTIKDSTVYSHAPNGNGLFSYGQGTMVSAKNVAITTKGNNSGGLQTTGGGTTKAENVTVSTAGNSAAAIRSDRGGGTIRVKGGTFKTEGYGSPAIYSTADIAVDHAALSASHSEGAVIEGKNSISLKNCSLEGSMSDTRVMGNQTIKEENIHTVMIYQSMSGDAEQGTSAFSMEGGSLISHKGDVFYVTNTDCTIHLKQVKITSEDPSGAFLRIAGNSASRGWGTAGANGGKVLFTAEKQDISGDILVDSISALDMTLGKNSRWTGSLQATANDKAAEGKKAEINLTIEKGAVWNLTADSTVTTLNNNGTINKNGHTLTILNEK